MKLLLIGTALLALAACASPDGAAGPASLGQVAPVPAGGLARVLGQDAAGLARLFGPPEADVREGAARKLQFASAICVLDAYLYPKGASEPRVTWLDAREPDGSPIDRASCVAALAHARR